MEFERSSRKSITKNNQETKPGSLLAISSRSLTRRSRRSWRASLFRKSVFE